MDGVSVFFYCVVGSLALALWTLFWYCAGGDDEQAKWHKYMIGRGLAQYHPKTGKWEALDGDGPDNE